MLTRCVRINKFGYVIIPHSESVLRLIWLIFKNFAYKCTFQPNIYNTSFLVMSSGLSLDRWYTYIRKYGIECMHIINITTRTPCENGEKCYGTTKNYTDIYNLFILLHGKGTARPPFNIWHFCFSGNNNKKCIAAIYFCQFL